MQRHNDLVKKLTGAAQKGEDLLPILWAEQAHLVGCATCRQQLLGLARAILGQEELLFLNLVRQEASGQLEAPVNYPDFDLSFLLEPEPAPELADAPLEPAPETSPTPNLWRKLPLPAAADAGRQVRQLVEGISLQVRVHKDKMEASFEGLSDRLTSTVRPAHDPVVAPRRRKRSGSGQVLPLPDLEENLDIKLAVQAAAHGRSHLSLEVEPEPSGQPPRRILISLQNPEGVEVAHTTQGKATFINLDPGQYTIEIKPDEGQKAGPIWRFELTLRTT